MNDTYFKIVLACIPILGTIITTIIIPYIKTQIDAQKLETYTEWADKAVWCAQQIYTPEQWAEKKTYCINFLADHCAGITADQINVLIEAAVKELKLAEKAVEGN